MITYLITLVFLAVLHGYRWHNRPARDPIRLDNPRPKFHEGRQ
jgi:hypothetical protein